MLKIAPIPDAAYEICTIFAPDCRNQSRHRYGQIDYSNMRNYGPLARTTSSTYYEGSRNIDTDQSNRSTNFSGEILSTSRPYYESKYNINASSHYGQNENLTKRVENDYDEGSEEENEVEDYILVYGAPNETYTTVGTSVHNESAVS